VARAVFVAEANFAQTVRRSEEIRERQEMLLTLSMTTVLQGIDLRGRDLSGAVLRAKNMDRADLRDANLEGVIFEQVSLAGGSRARICAAP
jgi:uncharacterized protein YjbI with pentapeptide repeats